MNIEVYYDVHHPYDVDDMVASSKAGLAYDQQFFSPYQFTQYRIMEFPRYRSFAQSFLTPSRSLRVSASSVGRRSRPTSI